MSSLKSRVVETALDELVAHFEELEDSRCSVNLRPPLVTVLVAAVMAVLAGIDRPVVAIDGKTLRRTPDHKKGLHALHSVTAWASDDGLCLCQVATDPEIE